LSAARRAFRGAWPAARGGQPGTGPAAARMFPGPVPQRRGRPGLPSSGPRRRAGARGHLASAAGRWAGVARRRAGVARRRASVARRRASVARRRASVARRRASVARRRVGAAGWWASARRHPPRVAGCRTVAGCRSFAGWWASARGRPPSALARRPTPRRQQAGQGVGEGALPGPCATSRGRRLTRWSGPAVHAWGWPDVALPSARRAAHPGRARSCSGRPRSGLVAADLAGGRLALPLVPHLAQHICRSLRCRERTSQPGTGRLAPHDSCPASLLSGLA
jgi:hypothetical protein